jgi:crossover junction endodeoxyribonuclease RuvC
MTKLYSSMGLDLSTAATGIVMLQASGLKKPFCVLEMEVKPKAMTGMDRVRFIVTEIMERVHLHKPDRIVVEGYSLNMKNAASVVPLVELGGLLRFMLHIDELKWLDPRAGQVKEFATGKGNSPKDMVMMNVLKRWGHESKTNNTADAYVCAAMGLAHVGRLPEISARMIAIAGELKLNSS